MRETPADLVVLDLMLPGIDGLEVCRRLREQGDVPVIMLTALGGETDRVVGLEQAPMTTSPSHSRPRELVLRVDGVLRRTGEKSAPEGPLVDGDLVVDARQHIATLRGEQLQLTVREFDLLRFLVANPGVAYPATSCCPRFGAGPSATSRRSPCTCADCARRSRPTRRTRHGWSPSGASAIAGTRARRLRCAAKRASKPPRRTRFHDPRPGRDRPHRVRLGGWGRRRRAGPRLRPAAALAALALGVRRAGRRRRRRRRDHRDRAGDVPLRPRLRGRPDRCLVAGLVSKIFFAIGYPIFALHEAHNTCGQRRAARCQAPFNKVAANISLLEDRFQGGSAGAGTARLAMYAFHHRREMALSSRRAVRVAAKK